MADSQEIPALAVTVPAFRPYGERSYQLRRGAPSAVCRSSAARWSASQEEKSGNPPSLRVCLRDFKLPQSLNSVDCGLCVLATLMRVAAAISAERPMPWRQWSATFLPCAQHIDDVVDKLHDCLARARNTAVGDRKGSEFEPAGRRGGRFARQGEGGTSLGSRSDTTTSMPASRQARVSSSIQSAPRGRGTIPSRPCHGPVIQKTFAAIPSILPPRVALLRAEGYPRRLPVRATPRFGGGRQAPCRLASSSAHQACPMPGRR